MSREGVITEQTVLLTFHTAIAKLNSMLKRNAFFLASYSLIFCVAIAAAQAAKPARPDFNRPQTFDAQHYAIRTSFDHAGKRVFGDTTVSVKPLKADFRTLELDSVDIAYSQVTLEPGGTALQHRLAPDKIIITLDKAYGPQDTINVRLKYTAQPKKGVYFVPEEEGPEGRGHSRQIWTQGEPDEARHWFPSFDFPSDKATTEQILTFEKGFSVIANGELVSRKENPDNTETWHYRMPVPHTTYLVSFIIGKYSKIEDKYRDIPLGYYVYPGIERIVPKAYGETKQMFAAFEELTGVPYPYNKYDQTIVSHFQFGGMENITATTMADTEIFFAEFQFGQGPVRDLVSHELAHSWFGNLVTCKNWAELWLNEGFATFMEAAYLEKSQGRKAYIEKVRTDAASYLVDDLMNRRKHGLFNQRADDVTSLFDNPNTTYHKGGAVVHTLREQVGNEAFWKGINAYLNRHKFGSVETTDLRRAMEEASGQDLGWFFDQWVYGTGAPRLTVRQTYSPRARTLTLAVTQTQRADALTPAAFRLPLTVSVATANGSTDHQIDVTKRVQTFTLPVAQRPRSVEIDRDEKIPLKTVKMQKLAIGR
jgi:aminopeptidase N